MTALSINGNSWISSSKTVTIKLNNGNNSISYYAKDDLGNMGSTINAIYFTYDDQILIAANSVKSYIETNNKLPTSVIVGGQSISTSQFLKNLVEIVLTINNGSRSLTPSWYNVSDPQFNQTENSINGIISDDEYIAIANYIKNFADNNGYYPNTVNTTLGTINFESLVYMYSKLLVTYDISSNSLDGSLDFIPWLAISNPDKFYNFNSQKIFNDLQSAINDLNTTNGDIIYVGKGLFKGNFFVNKEIAIKSLFGNSTFTALDPNQPAFSILSNFVEISDLNINGSTGTSAISISRLNNITISGNNITNNTVGINSLYSHNLLIFNNIITNNNAGITSTYGSNINIYWNTITNNGQGISLTFIDNGVSIISNTISNNVLGMKLAYSSGSVNFNAILNNSQHGLKSSFSNLNATNNWWGSNILTVSSNTGSHIDKFSGDVTHDSWLVLKTTIERDFTQSTDTTGVYIVTADLTYNNQGQDTYNEGTLPDDLAIKFSTTRGTINATVFTSRGKAKSVLKVTNDGLTNITSSSGVQNALYSGTLNVSVSGVYNNRTNKYFTSIQSAINDATTLAGDTLLLANGIFTENIIINKKITIKAINSGKVFINAFDFEKNVFTINAGGSGSTIQGLFIIEAYDAYGIFLNSTSNCNILNNTINDNDYGIYLHKSINNTMLGNDIYDNNEGIHLENSTNNQILKNKIKNIPNCSIYLENSNHNMLSQNTLNNAYIGIDLENSTNNNISSNDIIGSCYALYFSESNGLNIVNNNLINSWIGIYSHNSSGIIGENNVSSNEYGICLYDAVFNITGVNFTNNKENILNINSTGIIMAEFPFECGAASLTYVLRNLGLNVSFDELIEILEIDQNGVSIYGIINLARDKGLIANCLILSANNLKQNNIVYMVINGEGHFAVVKNILNNVIYLADSTLGNINMLLSEFEEFYSGKTIVITNDSNNNQFINSTILTDEESQELIGRGIYIVNTFKISKKLVGKNTKNAVVIVTLKRKLTYTVAFTIRIYYTTTSGLKLCKDTYFLCRKSYIGRTYMLYFNVPYAKSFSLYEFGVVSRRL